MQELVLNQTAQELRGAPQWRRHLTVLAAIAVIVALNAMLIWMLYGGHQAARQTAVQSATNLAAALERDIARSIELYDLSLQAVQDGMRLPEIEAYSPQLRSLILFDRAASARYLGSIRVFNANGDLIAASTREGATAAGEVATQDFFRVHRTDPDAGLFVSGPVRNPRTGVHEIILSRRLTRTNGSFSGVVSGSIRLSFFRARFTDLDLGDRSVIAMFHAGGTLVLRMPFDEADIGRNVPAASIFQYFPREHSGVYESVARIDGERRLYVYSQIADLPLVLLVATSIRSIYADWWRQAIWLSVAMVLLDATAFALLAGFVRELRQRTATEVELARANAELAELATQDPLTGLANRRALADIMRREWRRSTRQEDPLSLLVLDVDNFKAFNDRYGHGQGDECLKHVASAITGAIRRPGDLAARYGGEEFVVVLPATYLDSAVAVAEKLRHAVGRLRMPHEEARSGFVSISIGVACSASLAKPSIETLIETADRALYQAKRSGRDRTVSLPDPASYDLALCS